METITNAATQVTNSLAQNFGGVTNSLAPAEHRFSLEDVPDLSGKVALVTGGSQGIGYGCSRTLLDKGIKKLFVLSTSKEVVDGAIEAIKKEVGEDAANRTQWIQCDLSDWSKVKDAAEQIKRSTDRLDILINNAARGIMTYQLAETTGIDLHMATNHMGHVVLTSHLLPLLKKTAESGNTVRIVNLASNAHQNVPKDVKFASVEELNQDFGPMQQYGRSKLAVLLYARWLNKNLTSKYPNILVNASHPGFVRTKASVEDIHEAYPLAGYAMSVGIDAFKKDQFEGAISTMFAATKTDKSGEYICPPAIPEPGTELAQDMNLADQLMKLTVELVREKTYPESAAKGCPFTLA